MVIKIKISEINRFKEKICELESSQEELTNNVI